MLPDLNLNDEPCFPGNSKVPSGGGAWAMNPVKFWFAIFALLGLMIVAPGWMYWTSESATAALPTHVTFLVSLLLPITILLTMASWVQPG